MSPAVTDKPEQAASDIDSQISQLREQMAGLQQEVQTLQASKPRKPADDLGNRRYGRRLNRQHSPERTEEFLALCKAFNEKRLDWEEQADDSPPGMWYFSDIAGLVEFLAKWSGPFDAAAAGLMQVGYMILRSADRHHANLATLYPSDGLGTSIAAALKRAEDFEHYLEDANRLSAKERSRLPQLAAALRNTLAGDTDAGHAYVNNVNLGIW